MTSAERIVLQGGRVVDSRGERVADVAVQGGVVVEVGEQLTSGRTIDASGCVVAPGFVDLHAHLREPGKEEAETIETGSRAGAKGWLHGPRGDAQHRPAARQRGRHRLRA